MRRDGGLFLILPDYYCSCAYSFIQCFQPMDIIQYVAWCKQNGEVRYFPTNQGFKRIYCFHMFVWLLSLVHTYEQYTRTLSKYTCLITPSCPDIIWSFFILCSRTNFLYPFFIVRLNFLFSMFICITIYWKRNIACLNNMWW